MIPKTLRDALDSDPSDIHSLHRLAVFYQEAGSFQRAIRIYEKILNISPQDIDAIIGISRLFHQMGNTDAAEAILSDAIKKGCDELRLLNQYGLILHSKGMTDRAIEIFRQNIHSHPTNNETYILLGNILSDIDLIDAAIACY
ncbi:MAG: tetratricopeptide repeat protein, partial [Thermodesulfovibrionales bacterium]